MRGSDYLLQFFNRHGHLMVASNVVTKLMGFVAVVFVTRQTTAADFGAYSYAMNLVGAVVPFMGLGAYQSFLRFAPESKGQRSKKALFDYAFTRGLVASACIFGALQIFALWMCNAVPSSLWSFRVVSLVVVTTMVMESVKGYARAIHRNHIAAKIDVIYALALISSTVVLTTDMGIVGYAISVAMSPLLATAWHASRMKLMRWNWGALPDGHVGFWSYGLFTTVGALLARFFYAIDVLVIGQHWGEEAESIAIYRVALLIPMATLVLPISVAATDFVGNASIKFDAAALRSYVRNYWKTFGLLSSVVLSLVWVFSPQLLSVFGAEYIAGTDVMRTFLVGIMGGHLLRVPFGHLLSAVGRADLNTYANGVVVLATIAGCWMVVPQQGIAGAAAVMASMIWFSGLLYAVLFEWHLRSLARRPKKGEQQEQI